MAKMTPSCRNESTALASALAEKGSFSSAPDGAGVGLRGRSCVHSFGGGGRRGADARDGAAASSRRRRPALSMGAKWSVAPIRATVATRAKATRPRTMEAEDRPSGGGRMAARGALFPLFRFYHSARSPAVAKTQSGACETPEPRILPHAYV